MLRAECERVYEDGLAYVRLRYTDSGGITLPHENGRLKAEVTGGTLEAFGNACPWNPDGYTRPECDTWRGEAMAVIRCGDDETVLEVSDGRMKAHCVLPTVTI